MIDRADLLDVSVDEELADTDAGWHEHLFGGYEPRMSRVDSEDAPADGDEEFEDDDSSTDEGAEDDGDDSDIEFDDDEDEDGTEEFFEEEEDDEDEDEGECDE